MLEKQLSYWWFSCFLFGPLAEILSSCSGFELGVLQHQVRQLCHGQTPKCCTLTLEQWSCSKLHCCVDDHMAHGVSIRWLMDAKFRDAIFDCTFQLWHGCIWLPYDEKSLITFPAQKGTRQNLLLCHTCKYPQLWLQGLPDLTLPSARSPSATAPHQDGAIPLFPRKMHLPYRDESYWREIEIDPHHLWNLDFFKRLNSTVLFSCTVTLPLHQYDGGFQQWVHPPYYKPCTRWAVTHQKQHEDNILPCRNNKKSNMNRCRCGSRGGIFFHVWMQHWDWAVLADTISQHVPFKIGVCWRGKKEKDWQNEGSAWREWLQCGNLSIFEAQKRPCLDKTQGKQHNLCLAGLHSDGYSWCSVKIEELMNFELQLKWQRIWIKHNSWTLSCEKISAGTKNQTRYRQLIPQKSLLKPKLYNGTIYNCTMLQLGKKDLAKPHSV